PPAPGGLPGFGCRRRRPSSMLGFVLPGGRLPHPGFGTVFIDGPAPALAYHIGPDSVRVMFNVPDNPHGVDAATRDLAYLAALPPLLREDVRQAMDARRGLASASYSVVPDAVARHRVVLVGDAAGCCHPLTATGFSVCTRDAVRLRDALRASGGDGPAGAAHGGARGALRRVRRAHARGASTPPGAAAVLGVEPARPSGLDDAPVYRGRSHVGHGPGVRVGGAVHARRPADAA